MFRGDANDKGRLEARTAEFGMIADARTSHALIEAIDGLTRSAAVLTDIRDFHY